MKEWLSAGRLRGLLPFLVDPAARFRQLVPVSVRHQIWCWRTLQAFGELPEAQLRRLLADLESAVDLGRLRALRDAHRRGPVELAELCDYERKLEIAVVKALLAKLHTAPALRILDLGCGGGYFVAVCRQLGHTCEGTEVPLSRLSLATAAGYAGVSAALQVAPIELVISAKTPIDAPALQPHNYDLITAHKICFNGHMRPSCWSTAEWKFFVTDIARFLAPGGRLVLDLNEDVARYGARRWYDAELERYFRAVGDVVRGRITIPAASISPR